MAQDYLQILIEGSITDKLFLAEELAKDKEKMKDNIQAMIEVAHAHFIDKPAETTYAKILYTLQLTHTTLTTTNVNPRITFEHYFLTL
jgi:hypothetical protein